MRYKNLGLLLLPLLFLVTGCNAVRYGASKPIQPLSLKHLRFDYTNANAGNYFRTEYASAGTNQVAIRNAIIEEVMGVMDSSYNTYEWSLRDLKTIKDTVADLTALGLTTASTAVGGAATKTILSGIATGVLGANATLDKNVFKDQTIQTLQLQMQAQRKIQEARIAQRMTNSVNVYPLEAALRDLEEYYFAGSVTRALQAMVTTAQQSKTAAEISVDVAKGVKIP
ncbi:MAG: hypothetical protein H0X66_04040 [Verrucomicrobia bacterium]|nr:hypothetical protein [Verrucomicrobiota bacterium]